MSKFNGAPKASMIDSAGPLDGTEIVEISQGATGKAVTMDQIVTFSQLTLAKIGIGDMGGGLLIKSVVANTGVIPGGSGPFNIPVQIPSGVFIIGCQQRVNSAFHEIDNWDTDYTGGCTGQITVNGSYEKNTLMSRFYLINSTTNVPTGLTDIALIKSGGGSFQNTGAIVEAIVYYLDFVTLDDKA
jgi:hypothetical protein